LNDPIYIKGAVALALKAKYPSAEFIAFVRSTKLVSEIESLGFKTLVGSGVGEHDRSIITKAALTADIVINTADADDLELTNAILGAVQNSTTRSPILIHTRFVPLNVILLYSCPHACATVVLGYFWREIVGS
jgi:hypothetical protein